jgi:hypothetical protein
MRLTVVLPERTKEIFAFQVMLRCGDWSARYCRQRVVQPGQALVDILQGGSASGEAKGGDERNEETGMHGSPLEGEIINGEW